MLHRLWLLAWEWERPLGDYFTDPAANGNSFVRTVESALSRSAKIERTSATTETDSFNDEENQLVFCVGDISEMGGILVNSANKKLEHGSGVAAALQGKFSEMAIDKDTASGLKEGDLVISNAKNASFIKMLKQLCANHAGSDIVIPFFGCGQFGFNKSTMAMNIARALNIVTKRYDNRIVVVLATSEDAVLVKEAVRTVRGFASARRSVLNLEVGRRTGGFNAALAARRRLCADRRLAAGPRPRFRREPGTAATHYAGSTFAFLKSSGQVLRKTVVSL